MKRAEIIRLAEEAKVMIAGDAAWRLCELVAAAEREACAKIVENYTGAWDDQGYAIAQAIRARGGEDKFEIKEDRIHRDPGGTRAATAIRARGQE